MGSINRFFHPLLATFTSLVLFGLIQPVQAQFNDVFNIPPDPDIGDNESIGSDTQVNLFTGGNIGDYFDVGETGSTNVELNVSGGNVGRSLEVKSGSVVNVSGGVIGQSVSVGGGDFNVTGGIVGAFLSVQLGGDANISGGTLDTVRAFGSGVITVTGGYLGIDTQVFGGGNFYMRGGTMGEGFQLYHSGQATFYGNEFLLDGVSVSASVDVPPGSILTGTLEDGSVLILGEPFTSTIDDAGSLWLSIQSIPGNSGQTFDVPPDPAPPGLRIGQTLNLLSGGQASHGFASVGGTINLQGGTLGEQTKLLNSTLNVTSGSIGDGLWAMDSTVNVSDATVGKYFRVKDSIVSISGGTIDLYSRFEDSMVTMTGGETGWSTWIFGDSVFDMQGGQLGRALVGQFNVANQTQLTQSGGLIDEVTVRSGCSFEMTGGVVGNGNDDIDAEDGSTILISGGFVNGDMYLYSGCEVDISGGSFGDFNTFNGANVSLAGGNFELDGVPVSGLVNMTNGSVLTGVLEDGSLFVFFNSSNTVTSRTYDLISAGTLNLMTTSTPPVGPPVIDISSANTLNSVRDGQTLNLLPGGQLRNYFSARDGIVNVVGGTMGEGYQYMEFVNSLVNVESGALEGSPYLFEGTEFHWSGGDITGLFTVHDGTSLYLHGSSFSIDGVDITASLTPGVPFLVVDRSIELSGVLNDGTSFSFGLTPFTLWEGDYFSSNASVYVTLPVPSPIAAIGSKFLDGLVLAGQMSDITSSDDMDWELSPEATANPIKQKIDLILLAETNVTDPSNFSFRMESEMAGGPVGDVVQTLAFWNEQTSNWDVMDVRPAANPDEMVTINATGDLTRYIHPITSEIIVKITWASESFSGSPFFWTLDLDQAVWLIQ